MDGITKNLATKRLSELEKELVEIREKRREIKRQLFALAEQWDTLRDQLSAYKLRRGAVVGEMERIQKIMSGGELHFERCNFHLTPEDVSLPSLWWLQAKKIREELH